MIEPTLFDDGPPDPIPKNDAAPLAGGAGVSDPRAAHNPTPPAPRNAPPGTSEVAARRVAGQTRKPRERILAAIVRAGTAGLTDDEGEAALRFRSQSYTPRRGELRKLGLIVDSGRRRDTSSGCPAAVWVAATLATLSGEGAK